MQAGVCAHVSACVGEGRAHPVRRTHREVVCRGAWAPRPPLLEGPRADVLIMTEGGGLVRGVSAVPRRGTQTQIGGGDRG